MRQKLTDKQLAFLRQRLNCDTDLALKNRLSKDDFEMDDGKYCTIDNRTLKSLVIEKKPFGQAKTLEKFKKLLKSLEIDPEVFFESSNTSKKELIEQTITIPLGISEETQKYLCRPHSLVGTYRILRMTIASNAGDYQFVREKLRIFENNDRIDFILESKKAIGGLRTYHGSVALFREMLTLIGVYNDGTPINSLRIITMLDEGPQALADHHRIRWGMLTTGIIGTKATNGSPISRRLLLEKPRLDENGDLYQEIVPDTLTYAQITEEYGPLAPEVRELIGIKDLKSGGALDRSNIDLREAYCIDQAIIDQLSGSLVERLDRNIQQT